MQFRFILWCTFFLSSFHSLAHFPQFDTFTPEQQHAIFEKLYNTVMGKNTESQILSIASSTWTFDILSIKKGSFRQHQDYMIDSNFIMGIEAGLIEFNNKNDCCTLRIEEQTYSFKMLEHKQSVVNQSTQNIHQIYPTSKIFTLKEDRLNNAVLSHLRRKIRTRTIEFSPTQNPYTSTCLLRCFEETANHNVMGLLRAGAHKNEFIPVIREYWLRPRSESEFKGLKTNKLPFIRPLFPALEDASIIHLLPATYVVDQLDETNIEHFYVDYLNEVLSVELLNPTPTLLIALAKATSTHVFVWKVRQKDLNNDDDDIEPDYAEIESMHHFINTEGTKSIHILQHPSGHLEKIEPVL